MSGLLVAGPQTPSYAQDLQNAQPSGQNAPDKMDQLPDDYIEEVMKFYDTCTLDPVQSAYYNCECLTVAYLDERKKQGPLGTQSSIRTAIIDKCKDAVGAAGDVYDSCLSKSSRFEAGTDPEKYCECVANTYVETINNTGPRINSTTIVGYQTMAYSACSNPDGPKPAMMYERQQP